MPHLALLGDASLANGRYTAPEPDTATQVQQQLPDWTVTLLAAGGATMAEIPAQLQRFPAGVDLAVLSVGGNDALEHVGLLQQPSKSSSDTLDALHRMVQEFAEKYDKVVPVLSRLAGRVLLCTIYEAPLVGENTASRARVVLTLLNDYILRTAARGGMDVLDLRSICSSKDDFVMQIEPSAKGAAKIGQAVARAATGQGGRRLSVIIG